MKNAFNKFARILVFDVVLALPAMSIILALLPCLLFRIIKFRYIYSTLTKAAESMFGSVVVILTYIMYYPQVLELVLSGDHHKLSRSGKNVVISNHQTFADWWYLWLLAWSKGMHIVMIFLYVLNLQQTGCQGDVKFILVYWVKYIPIMGWGVWLFEFVFMKQKFHLDQANIEKYLNRIRTTGLSYWLCIFPEGMVNRIRNIETSRKFAEKICYKNHPKHVLLPKSTGILKSF